jgi:hypothetical protein
MEKNESLDVAGLFTPKELKDLAIPLPERIIRSIRSGELDNVNRFQNIRIRKGINHDRGDI